MDRLRVTVIAAILFLPLGGLEARLLYMQLWARDRIVGRTVGARASINLSGAMRGEIRDARGRVLARDERAFDLYLVFEEFEKNPETRRALETALKESLDEPIQAAYRKIEKQMEMRPERERPLVCRRERRAPYLVRRGLTVEQAFAIETDPDRFPGCIIREGLRRRYDFGRAAGHIVGYVGLVSDAAAPGRTSEYDRLLDANYFTEDFEELIGEDGIALLAKRGAFLQEMIGRTGVEKSCNDRLRGRPGLLILQRDPETGAQDWIELKPSRPGEDVDLTIDIELQRDIEAILDGASDECPHKVRAHAVVMDPTTGDIVALASNAGYDPNDFIPPIRSEVYRRYLDDPWKPLVAHAWADHKQSGSVFKIATALAALQEGAATPSTTTDCNGHYESRVTNKFNCWTVASHAAPHATQDVAGALQHSCNIFFFTAGERMGLEPMWRWADRLGFGRKSGLDLPGEVPGILPSPASHPRWSRTDSLNLAIGQGALSVTPIQVARATAVIASGGTLVTPGVVKGAVRPSESLPIPEPSLQAIRKGLTDCTHVRGGTAFDAGLAKFGAVGKTGSAQREDRAHPHCWFAGWFPAEAPRYVVVVLCEDAKGGGGHVAAPLAAKIIERICR
jgi:penicillin-binding protein 2